MFGGDSTPCTELDYCCVRLLGKCTDSSVGIRLHRISLSRTLLFARFILYREKNTTDLIGDLLRE